MTFKKFSIALLMASVSLVAIQSEQAMGEMTQTGRGGQQGDQQSSQASKKENQSTGQRHRRHQSSSGQRNSSSQQAGATSSSSSGGPQSSNATSQEGGTNKYPIEVVYTGTHVGQKLDGGKIVEDSTLPVAHIECGGKSFDISSTEKKLTIPAGTIPTSGGPYYKVGVDGKFIPTSIPPGRETLPGKALHCNYSTIGHAGFLGKLSYKVKRIEIGQTIADNTVFYDQ